MTTDRGTVIQSLGSKTHRVRVFARVTVPTPKAGKVIAFKPKKKGLWAWAEEKLGLRRAA